MISKIKHILRGLKNLWRWRKVIYRDRDFDHWFIYEMLKTKLQFQADSIYKNGTHTTAESNAAVMLKCIDMIDKVQNEYYIDQALTGLEMYDWTDVQWDEAVKKHDDTRKLLFKTLEENIERWWD